MLGFFAKPEHVASLIGKPCGGVFYSGRLGWLQLGMQALGERRLRTKSLYLHPQGRSCAGGLGVAVAIAPRKFPAVKSVLHPLCLLRSCHRGYSVGGHRGAGCLWHPEAIAATARGGVDGAGGHRQYGARWARIRVDVTAWHLSALQLLPGLAMCAPFDFGGRRTACRKAQACAAFAHGFGGHVQCSLLVCPCAAYRVAMICKSVDRSAAAAPGMWHAVDVAWALLVRLRGRMPANAPASPQAGASAVRAPEVKHHCTMLKSCAI